MSRPRTRAGALSTERTTDDLELVRAENAALRAELDLHREVVRRAADLCEAAAGGDLEARLIGIEARGDLGRLTSRLNHLLDATDAFTRESRAALEHASAGKFYRRVLLRGMPGSFRHASRAINAATARMAGQAQALADAASRRAALAGDFEFAIGTVVATLASAATELRATAESMTETAMETSGRASSVASAATETAASVNSAAVVAEQLSAAAGEIGRRAAESAVATSRAAMGAATAHDILHQFAAASTRIGRVVKMIAEVSSQTRLLALNATIEAARAGEAGRGFAVVASEVKSLAQQTASATEEVANEIGAVQSASSRAIGALDGILGSMAQLEEITATIAGAVEEQRAATTQMSANVRTAASGTEQVSRNIGEVTHGVANTSEAATQMLAAAAELSKQAEGLRGAVDAFLQHMRQG